MKRLFFLILIIFVNVIVYSDSVINRILELNNNYNPYQDIEITMGIDSVIFEGWEIGKENVKKMIEFQSPAGFIIKFGKMNFEMLPEGLNQNDEFIKNISMLFKYLSPWYLGTFIYEGTKIFSETKGELILEKEYIYKEIESINRYIFNEGILKSINIYKNNLNELSVCTDYDFFEDDGVFHLSSWRSRNLNHGFDFNVYIQYEEIDEVQVPINIIIENVDKKLKSRYKYKFINHFVEKD